MINKNSYILSTQRTTDGYGIIFFVSGAGNTFVN